MVTLCVRSEWVHPQVWAGDRGGPVLRVQLVQPPGGSAGRAPRAPLLRRGRGPAQQQPHRRPQPQGQSTPLHSCPVPHLKTLLSNIFVERERWVFVSRKELPETIFFAGRIVFVIIW